MARRQLTGVLLVGGASRRFGSPKALARLDGKTLAEQAWGTLGEACGERLAFGKVADELDLPFPVHDDGTDLRAPLAGVVAGLRAAPTDVAVMLPVDAPLVTAELLQDLADACTDAAVTHWGSLPAAFRKTALPVLERRLRDGRLALHKALAELDTTRIEVDATLLANENNPDELLRLG
jgi:molybdopterin-guanine dinucleotide biosynthesis protein A